MGWNIRPPWNSDGYVRVGIQRTAACALLLGLLLTVWQLSNEPGHQELSFSLILGIAVGVVLQRSRFCFFCMTRDFTEDRDSRGLLGLVVALAVGTFGYMALFGAMLPIPSPGRLPPDAHIGPVSWVLVLASCLFGAGMAISGSCISAHLYRLGEGACASFFALLGVLFGFLLGFKTWNVLYLAVLQESKVVWLPNILGYGGTTIVQLLLLGAVAIFLASRHKKATDTSKEETDPVLVRVFVHRWPAYVGGLLLGFIATIAFFRVSPLGVTAELGSMARSIGSRWNLLPERLEGLDSFAGCTAVIRDSLVSPNGLFVLGLVLASGASALFAGQFQLQRLTGPLLLRNFIGGIAMGWGGMLALGCTVGTLLSGIMAGALSGWVFAVFCFLGLSITWNLRRRLETRGG